MSETASITVYCTKWCPACRRVKMFLNAQKIHCNWVDINKDAEAAAYVEQVNNGMRTTPTIVFGDGSILVEPSNAQLAAKLGLDT